VGYYVKPYSESSGEVRTVELCPEHGECLGGLKTPIPSFGYWLDHSHVDYIATFYKCSRSICNAGIGSSRCYELHHFNHSDCLNEQCEEGSTGPLCGSCLLGYVYQPMSTSCEFCRVSSQTILIIAGSIMLGIMILFATFSRIKEWRCVKRIMRFWGYLDGGSLKIAWVTYQILVSCSFSMSIKVLSTMRSMFILQFFFLMCFMTFKTRFNRFFQNVCVYVSSFSTSSPIHTA
jgi:hypothetical protein